jgi:hypothetical protein
MLGFVFLWQPVISAIAFSLAAIEILLVTLGILALPNRNIFLKALLYIPSFIAMWIKGVLLSLKRHPWLRVRQPLNDNKETGIFTMPLSNSEVLNKN